MKQTNFKNIVKEKGKEIFIKLGISIFFLILFSFLFIFLGGMTYFEKANYVKEFKNYNFELHAINVGQGDSFLIKFPNKKVMMIDTGDEKHFDVLSSYTNQFLSNEKIKNIDYLVLTHADEDHLGSAAKFIDKYNVLNIYRPKQYSLNEGEYIATDEGFNTSDSQHYDNAITKAYEKGINIIYSEKGISFFEQGCKIEFLSPALNNYSNDNDYSAVIMLTYQTKKFLLTGDISKNIEETLISTYGDYLKADVLKLAHHGSKTSNTEAFIEKVNPEYAILSVAQKNSYNLPDAELIDSLNEKEIKIISTAEKGNFVFSVANDKVVVAYEKAHNENIPLLFVVSMVVILIIWTIPYSKQTLINED